MIFGLSKRGKLFIILFKLKFKYSIKNKEIRAGNLQKFGLSQMKIIINNSYLFYSLQITPVWIILILAPFGVLALPQQSTKVRTTRFWNIQLRYIGTIAMRVCKYDFVFAFITVFDVANAKCNCVSFAIGVEFIANAFDKRSHTFVVKFVCWCRCTLNLDTDVCSFTWLNKFISFYSSHQTEEC